jgi:uncharacterized protein (TIGR04222 family)
MALGIDTAGNLGGMAGASTSGPGAGPTWGIEGPDFLGAFGAAGFLLLAIIVALRIATGRRFARVPVEPCHLRPLDLAYLSGGPFHAVATGLWLSESRHGVPDPLMWAVAPAAGAGVTAKTVLEDPAVKVHLKNRHRELAGQGLLRSYGSVLAFRCLRLAALAWVVLGLLRLAAGMANGRPTESLATLLIIGGIALFGAVFRVPTITEKGLKLIRELRRENRDLSPRGRNGYAGMDPARVTLGAAVFGSAALWIAAPASAAAMGVPAIGNAGAGAAYYAGNAGFTVSGGSDGSSSCSSGGCGGGSCGG